jgi:hypothetical protein
MPLRGSPKASRLIPLSVPLCLGASNFCSWGKCEGEKQRDHVSSHSLCLCAFVVQISAPGENVKRKNSAIVSLPTLCAFVVQISAPGENVKRKNSAIVS